MKKWKWFASSSSRSYIGELSWSSLVTSSWTIPCFHHLEPLLFLVWNRYHCRRHHVNSTSHTQLSPHWQQYEHIKQWLHEQDSSPSTGQSQCIDEKKRVCMQWPGFQKFVVSRRPYRAWVSNLIATTTMQGGKCTPVARRVLGEERKKDSRKRKSFKYFPAGRLLGVQRHC